MKLLPIVATTGFLATLLVSTAALADPAGDWLVSDQTATVRIRKCGGSAYCGFIAKTASAPGKDDKNPDPAKRNRSVIGLEVLINMRPAGSSVWQGATYNAQDGQIYSASMSVSADDRTLNIRGCAPGGGMCGSEAWKRVR
ncbi:MAG: DUF2147 domain-containing protein [Methylovirgula sp.]